jgi:hypothetical protein
MHIVQDETARKFYLTTAYGRRTNPSLTVDATPYSALSDASNAMNRTETEKAKKGYKKVAASKILQALEVQIPSSLHKFISGATTKASKPEKETFTPIASTDFV